MGLPGGAPESVRAALAPWLNVIRRLNSGGLQHYPGSPVLAAASQELGLPARVAVRVNPDFELKGSGMKMGGGAKPFGVDAERVPALARKIIDAGAEWHGLHIFAGSQALSAEAIIEAQANTLDLAARLAPIGLQARRAAVLSERLRLLKSAKASPSS